MKKVINDELDVVEVRLKDLKDLQPKGFKKWDKSQYIRFRERVLKVGIRYAFVGWKDPETGKIYIIDGHHRKKFLQMMEKEGYEIPEKYSCMLIKAKDINEAKEELLFANSRYADILEDGVADFIKSFPISQDTLSLINIPDIDIGADIEIPVINDISFDDNNKQKKDSDPASKKIVIDTISIKVDGADAVTVDKVVSMYNDGVVSVDDLKGIIIGALNEVLDSR